MKKTAFERPLIGLAVAACFAGVVHANPTGPAVVSGSASFATSGKTLTVTNVPGTIINWQQFSIRPDEVTRFIQSGAASAVLNRVTGGDPSAILGQLLSNGRVFLINPNGVVVGAGARIDTAGFVASSLNLSNEDFLAGRFRFTDPGSAGKVTNAGTIHAHSGGPVYLIAPTVENHGVITAPNGDIILAAGKSVELVSAASPHLRVQLQAGGEAMNVGQLIAESGFAGIYGAAIRNAGTVSADSASVNAAGNVVLKASRDVTLEATSVVSANGAQGGTVHVQAEGGTLLADGRIDAKGAVEMGGEVKLLGERVGLMNQAHVDASGRDGGGTVLVGGDYQGKNAEVQNARVTYVSPDANLVADATHAGDGGKVIVWADGTTRYAGSISARGGDAGGNGGFAEVSGKETLEFAGTADLRAPQGVTGDLLLDPKNILIQAGGLATVAGNDQFAENAAGTSVISGANLATAINGASVTLQANTDITFDDNVTATTANRNLTLQAGRSIIFNAGRVVTLNDSQFTATINDAAAQVANRDAGAAQFVMNAGSGIVTQGKTAGARGNVTINVGNFGGSSAGSQVTLLGGATVNASGTANRASGTVTIAGTSGTTVDTSGGTLVANGGVNSAAGVGRAGGAVTVTGGSVTTGAITARGSDGLGGNNVGGTGGAVTLTANAVGGALQVNGAIDTRGGNSVGNGNTGAGGAVILRTANSGTIASTAAGTITTTGGRGQTGGNVTVTSVTPASDTVATLDLAGAINVDGGATAASGTLGGKNAGTVAMANVNAITVGAISARGSASGGGNNSGGSGGAVTIDARNAAPSIALTGAVDTRGGDGTGTGNAGTGGLVRLRTAAGGSVTSTAAATINTTGGRGQTGGAVTVSGIAAADTLASVNLAGAITTNGGLTAASGTLGGKNAGAVAIGSATTIAVGPITARGSNAGAAIGNNNVGGNGGAVGVTRAGTASTMTFNGMIDTRGGNSSGTGNTGNGGAVTIDGGAAPNVGTVAFAAGAGIDTRGGRGQTGGNVIIRDASSVTFDPTASIDTSGGTGVTTGKNAGTVTMTAGITGPVALGAVTTRGSAAVAANSAGGNGGNVAVTSVGATLAGAVDTRGGDGTGTAAGGTSGTITVNGGAGPVTSTAAGTLTTRGARGSNGANVTVSTALAGSISLDGAIDAGGGNPATGQAGRAGGAVSVTGGDVRVGAITTDGAGAAAGNGGNAGTITLDATDATPVITLAGSLSARGGDAAGVGTGGTGANITLPDPVRLDADVTIDVRGGAGGAPAVRNVNFQSTVDAASATPRALVVNAAGTTAFGGAVGGTNALASLTTDAGGTTAVNGGAVTTTGAQTYNDAVTLGAATTFTSTASGNVTFNSTLNSAGANRAVTVNTAGTTTFGAAVGGVLALASLTTDAAGTTAINGGSVRTAGAQTYNDAVNTSGATTLTATAGGVIAAVNAANDFTGNLVLSTTGAASVVDANALALGASSVGTLTAQTLAGDITLNGAITASGGGDSIVLASGGNFANNVGPAALNPGAGRWLVYSTDPALDNRNGLVYDFKQYNATYGVTPVAGAGRGFLYSVAPTIATTLTGTATKTYDGTVVAPIGGLSLSAGPGAIDGDTVSLSLTGASYDTKHVGTGKLVTATGATVTASNAGRPVYGYQVDLASASANVGTINAAPLTITADDKARLYGDANPPLTASFAGLVSGDTPADIVGLTITTPAVPASNAGVYAITPTGGVNANYAITYVNGQLTINPAPLTITADDASRMYGFPNPAFTATATGFKLGQGFGDLAGSLAFSTPATTTSPVGVYPITPLGVSSPNYAITFVDGQLVVGQGIPPADQAFITAVERSESTGEPWTTSPEARGTDCLALERAGVRRVLRRCY